MTLRRVEELVPEAAGGLFQADAHLSVIHRLPTSVLLYESKAAAAQPVAGSRQRMAT